MHTATATTKTSRADKLPYRVLASSDSDRDH